MLLIAMAAAAEPDPTWVDAVVAGWISVPPDDRIDALQSMVTAETDVARKSALVALGRLEQSWPADGPVEAHAAYTRALLLAPHAGRRSYVVAAAGFGAALDSDGQPTMTVDHARTLYLDRRLALGVVAWHACGPPSGIFGAFQRAEEGGSWVVGDLDAFRERRRLTTTLVEPGPFTESRCRSDEVHAGTGLGWTLFEGSRPVRLARDLDGGPSRCEPLHVRVVRQAIVHPDGSVRGGGEVVDVILPARVQDCGTRDAWEALAREQNARIVSDLRLDRDNVADLGGSPSTLAGFRACVAKKPKEEIRELCAIE